MISFKNIHLSYQDKKILNDFSLRISSNDKLLIKGSSGSGKTSLLKLCLGFEIPRQGQIHVMDQIINEQSIFYLRQHIAYVDQNATLPQLSVHECMNWLNSQNKINPNPLPPDEVNELFDYFELNESHKNQKTDALSGGERSRIALIFALMLNRPILLLDEITSQIDSQIKLKVINHLSKLNNKTMLIISHDSEWNDHLSFKTFQMDSLSWAR